MKRTIPKSPVSFRLTMACLSMALVTALGACSRPTEVSSTWHEQRPAGRPYGSVLVIGVTENAGQRRRFESSMVTALLGRGVTAWPSNAHMSVETPLNRDTVGAVVEALGADAVLATRLLGHDVSGQEIDTRTAANPRPEDETIANLQRYDYNQYKTQNLFSKGDKEFEQPGYVVIKSTVTLSTDFYETENGELIYSLATTTYDKESEFEIREEVTAAIAKRLGQDRLVR